MQPIPPIVTAVQPIPPPVALPPTIPDEHYGHEPVSGDEVPFDVEGDRRARRRAIFVRVLGVLAILGTAAFAFVTVGRAWLRSLPSVAWPSSLFSPDRPALPEPVPPKDEPVLPATPVEPPLPSPLEAAPATPPDALESTAPESLSTEPLATERAASPSPPRVDSSQRSPSGAATSREGASGSVPPAAAAPVEESTPAERSAPEDLLPAPPSIDPAAPESPPAGEATPRIPADEGNTVFGED